MEFCPVCMLRKGLADGIASGESSVSEDTVKPAPDQPARRFDHYELVTGEDGKPVELGRGAMGVTYKAFDINLRCPVTLKVISERYLGDESARLRFLREARAAASVRHRTVLSDWGRRIRSCVNTSASNCGTNGPRLGGKATGGSTSITERRRRSYRILFGRWSHFSLAVICGCNAGLFQRSAE